MSDDREALSCGGFVEPFTGGAGAEGGAVVGSPVHAEISERRNSRPKDFSHEDDVRSALAMHRARDEDSAAAESYLGHVRKYGNDDASAFVTANAWVDHVARDPRAAHQLVGEMQRRPRGSEVASDPKRHNWAGGDDQLSDIENAARAAVVQLETRERNRQLMAQQGPQIEAIKQKFGGVKPFYDMARDLEQESQVNPGHAAARLQQQIAMGHQEAAGMAAASQVLASHDRASRAPAAIRQVAGQLLSDPRIFDGDLVSRDGAGALDTALDLAEAITAAETTGKDRVAGLDAAVRQAWTGNPLAGLPDEALMKFAQTDFGGMWGARQEVDAFSREHPDISQARWDAMAAGLAGGKF